jgi:peptidoglycan/xylan/chitin deacetylase (PgdA/CDA1 family)
MGTWGTTRIRKVLARARARLAPSTLVLMYHRVAAVSRDPWQMAVTPAHFAQHLQVIRRYGRPITCRDLGRELSRGRAPGRAIAVTFDDGYADNLLEARPLLERHDVPATIFIAAGCIGRPEGFWWDALERLVLGSTDLPSRLQLDIRGRSHHYDLGAGRGYPIEIQEEHVGWRAGSEPPTERHRLFLALYKLLRPLPDSERGRALNHLSEWAGVASTAPSPSRPLTAPELGALAGGGLVEIGAHTLTHPQLSALDRESQREEIRGSRLALHEAVGEEIASFAYPYGSRSDYTSETVALVKDAGFSSACATTQGVVRRGTGRFELPRFHVENCDGDGLARRLTQWTGAAA